MKKFFSIVLSIVLAANLTVIAFSRQVTPVVLVAGYSSTNLYKNAESDDRERVWKVDKDTLVPQLLSESLSIIADAAKENIGSLNLLADVAGPLAAQVFEPLALDEEGNSLYNVSPYPIGAESTRYDLLKKMPGSFIPEHACMKAIASEIGEKNLYLCTLDWRQSQVDCAAVLDKYLDDVREITGSSKVNLLGISFGGEVIGTYLTLYNDTAIDNVVLNVPALDGTSTATRLVGGEELDVQYSEILSFYMELERDESYKDLLFLENTVNLNLLDSTLQEIISSYLFNIFVNFGSVWDFVTADKYEEYKAKYLDDEKYARLIEESDIYHYQVQGKYAETFAGLRNAGIEVFIVAGFGSSLLTGDASDSDGVIDLLCSTGASSPAAEAVSCGNDDHYHISPDMTIDAATGFMPDYTWYVDGLMHGQSYWDATSTELIMTLLLTEEIDNVYSSDEYPQFMFAQNPGNVVTGKFNASKSGYITKYDSVFTVTNLSGQYDIVIEDITCAGADIRIDVDNTVTLSPGESIDFAVHGTAPACDTVCGITIEYMRYAEKAPLLESRTLTHSYIATENILGSVVRRDADTGAVMDDGQRTVSKDLTIDYIYAKIIFILEWLISLL